MDFSKIQDELGMTMVLITHDVNEAVLLSDKTVFLEEGKVKQEVNIALPKPRRFGDQNLLPFQQTLFNFFLLNLDNWNEKNIISLFIRTCATWP